MIHSDDSQTHRDMRYWPWPGGWGHGTTVCVVLNAAEREQLAAIVADCNRPRKHGERARIVLASADRHSAQQVAQRIGSVGRRCGGGNNASPRAGSRVYCAKRPASPGKAPIAAETTARVVALTPAFAGAGTAPRQRTKRPTGPAGQWPRPSASRWVRCSASPAVAPTADPPASPVPAT